MCCQFEQRVVLLVEDEAIIGIATADALEEAGFVVAGPISSTADALAWLSRMRPDVALVDIVLRDGPCMALVRELRRRGIPFLINSGHPRAKWRDKPDLAAAQWLEKPTGYMDLISALRALDTSCQGSAETKAA